MLSPEAQKYLKAWRPGGQWYPSPDDVEEWRAFVTRSDASAIAATRETVERLPVRIEARSYGFACIPNAVVGGALVLFHAGGFAFSSGERAAQLGALTANTYGRRTLVVDYRTTPDHPFPAALDDSLAAYRAILATEEPQHFAFIGQSSGANLATRLCIEARDSGLALPRCVILTSPFLDLTESGDSHDGNRSRDVVLQNTAGLIQLYAGDHDRSDPRLSPLFADFSKGFPPTLLLSGTRDLFLSDAVRLHRILRRYGQHFDLHVWESAPHGGFPSGPEAAETLLEITRFLQRFGI